MRQRSLLAATVLAVAVAGSAAPAVAQEAAPEPGAPVSVPTLPEPAGVNALIAQTGDNAFAKIDQKGADPGTPFGFLGGVPELGARADGVDAIARIGLLPFSVNAGVAQTGDDGEARIDQSGMDAPATAVVVDTGDANEIRLEQSGSARQDAFVSIRGDRINAPGAGDGAPDISYPDGSGDEDNTPGRVIDALEGGADGEVDQEGAGPNQALVLVGPSARESAFGIEQTNPGGPANRATIWQAARDSKVVQVQVGTDNTAFAWQEGRDNTALQYQEGAGNASKVHQWGSGNRFLHVQVGNNLGSGTLVEQSGGATARMVTVQGSGGS